MINIIFDEQPIFISPATASWASHPAQSSSPPASARHSPRRDGPRPDFLVHRRRRRQESRRRRAIQDFRPLPAQQCPRRGRSRLGRRFRANIRSMSIPASRLRHSPQHALYGDRLQQRASAASRSSPTAPNTHPRHRLAPRRHDLKKSSSPGGGVPIRVKDLPPCNSA